ncbi:hypothetical protein AERO8C_20432 [Aeromonas veronii]|uniref:Uncharacterized protein n=1 Tax=Aeromonas veronii TaxID=654 RepID=A0A653L1J9_AERVE|nr:hypothetical protein AERO8C_20432 [Aeromonas veronii]
MNALFTGHHQRLVDSHLFALHGQLAAQQVTEVGLLWLEGKGQREGEVQYPHVGADAIRIVDKPQIGHLFFQQLAVGFLIAAKVRRLEGGVGVTIEHKASPAHRQQNALIARKGGEGARALDGGRAQSIVKVEFGKAAPLGGDEDLAGSALLVFPGHLLVVRLFNQGDHGHFLTIKKRREPGTSAPAP